MPRNTHTHGDRRRKGGDLVSGVFLFVLVEARLPFDSLFWWLEVFSAGQGPGGNDGSSMTDIANLLHPV
jgi:hypothetical protein